MKLWRISLCLTSAAVLAGCVVMPTAPMIGALPGSQKSFDQFRIDDDNCRGVAQAGTGGAGQAAVNNAAANAAVGTALGAAAGAIIGSASGQAGAGAAIGAGTGLLFGSAAGSNYAGYSSYDLQRQYDSIYLQCMYAQGNRVPAQFVHGRTARYYTSPSYPPSNAPFGGPPTGGPAAPPAYPPPGTPPPPG